MQQKQRYRLFFIPHILFPKPGAYISHNATSSCELQVEMRSGLQRSGIAHFFLTPAACGKKLRPIQPDGTLRWPITTLRWITWLLSLVWTSPQYHNRLKTKDSPDNEVISGIPFSKFCTQTSAFLILKRDGTWWNSKERKLWIKQSCCLNCNKQCSWKLRSLGVSVNKTTSSPVWN